MRYYYLERDGKQIGPLSIVDLQQHKITKGTLIWFQDLSAWTEAKYIEELQDIIIATPPPLPVKRTSFDSVVKEKTKVSEVQPKYDPQYSKPTDAILLGILFIFVHVVVWTITISSILEYSESSKHFAIIVIRINVVVSLIFRIISMIWVNTIAKWQNRYPGRWEVFALLTPGIALIVIGNTKKIYKPN
jgi:hypothetical protein